MGARGKEIPRFRLFVFETASGKLYAHISSNPGWMLDELQKNLRLSGHLTLLLTASDLYPEDLPFALKGVSQEVYGTLEARKRCVELSAASPSVKETWISENS